MTASYCSFVIVSPPTRATASPGTFVELPPKAAAKSARKSASGRRVRSVLMKIAPVAAASSRCLTQVEYSIDEPQRSGEAVVSQAHLPVRARVHRRVDAAAEVAELAASEHERTDRR